MNSEHCMGLVKNIGITLFSILILDRIIRW